MSSSITPKNTSAPSREFTGSQFNNTLTNQNILGTIKMIFPDRILAKEIARILCKNSTDLVTASELMKLRKITLNSSNINNSIKNLKGIQYLTELQKLDLIGNKISDLRPLSRLTNLQELYLTYNRISDVSPLSELAGLRWLDVSFSYNQLDLNSFSGLTSLIWLNLSCNQIKDVSFLSRLTSLEFLYLNANKIINVSPLASLTALKHLNLNANKINDLRPLSSLSKERLLAHGQFIQLNSGSTKDPNPLSLFNQDASSPLISPRRGKFENNLITWETSGMNRLSWDNSTNFSGIACQKTF
ncbi:leucine-rich repeat domain-containing protein [Bacillus cereus]|uniref:leucine-rich repeat domain-containing protein n=1 Tax=Bacillus cereus TaxID=1396 RepID=UPI000BF88C3A|nr:leucine-rich repeat domain-containing protein [Bacillus cereus]PFI72437.1 hypothetical protein COI83_30920 [Bacillus cereus]